jgi:hypothetical protein
MDAVMYLAGAIDEFEGIWRERLQKIGFEIAMLGAEGFDISGSRQKYQLRSLPGRFCG